MTTCEYVQEAWGPNEGCREFMWNLSASPCAEEATYKLTWHDQYFDQLEPDDPDHPEGDCELLVCGRHLNEVQDHLRSDPDVTNLQVWKQVE